MLNCCQIKINEYDKIVRLTNGPLRHKKFSTEYSSNQIVHCNITMLSSIGAIACSSGRIMNLFGTMNGNGTYFNSSNQYTFAPMALALQCVTKFKSVKVRMDGIGILV